MKNIWKTFWEALHGSSRDYTQGSISKAVILLGIPMVLEMVMESVFAITDIFFVGELGSHAVATIGLTESLLTIVYTVGIGLSIGATAMMARRVGEQDMEGASYTAVQTIVIGIGVSVAIGIAGVILAPDLLRLMGGSQEIVDYGTAYMRVMFGGNIVILMLFLGNAIFRGAGDGAIAMRALWIANGLNLILVPCFVSGYLFFPKLGVTGAAVATTISRGVGAIYTLTHLMRGIGRVKIHKQHLTLKFDLILRILRLSGSGTLQVFIGSASWIGLVKVMSTFGDVAVAGYTIGFRIILFALFPAFGLGNAAATMVGQSLGAKNPDRAEKSVWIASLYNACFLGSMGILFVIFANTIVGWFTQDPITHAYAADCLTTVSYGFLFYAFGMVITQSFNGAGAVWTPTIINFFVFWLFEIPLAVVLAEYAGLGPKGVFISVTAGFSLLAVVSAIVFKRGTWKNQQV